MLSSEEKTVVFIDGANLYAIARGLEFDIDYKKLLALFREQSNLIRAYYYTVLIEDQEYSPIRPLVDWLDYNGYTLITKPAKDFTDSHGRRRIRNSIDVDLAVDMLEIAERVEHVVLFSGDGGYRRLVEAVQRRGARVTVISTTAGNASSVADELRRQADMFVDLRDLRSEVTRERA
ncbi:MAG: NYN domain-containing protein, partial [Rhodospirillaceae bacterium]|nr:NYN domain-containing protein [Rhodospirillaceae bacterium]